MQNAPYHMRGSEEDAHEKVILGTGIDWEGKEIPRASPLWRRGLNPPYLRVGGSA